MLQYLMQRLIQGFVVLFLVTLVTFALMQMAPGDPIDLMVGEALITDAEIDRIREKWGLNDPWYQQYFTWLGNVAQGDFGRSVVRTGEPVHEMVLEAAWPTMQLNVLALFVSTLVAVPAGVMAAMRRYSLLDSATMAWASAGIALPNFWIGLMLIILFAQQLSLLPPYGSGSWKHFILPVVVLAINEIALLTRLMRGATLEVMNQDFVTTARAKGLAERLVLVRHIVRNSLLPAITVIGLRVAFLLSGTIVVETIFAWPGIGRLFYDSILRLDYQVVQAIVVLFTVLVILANILTDLLYALVDPRIRVR